MKIYERIYVIAKKNILASISAMPEDKFNYRRRFLQTLYLEEKLGETLNV